MADIASGDLCIYIDKDSELNKSVVDEIINNLENNNHFTYCGPDGFNAHFNEKDRTLDFAFCGRWSCDSCWEWINNELSDAKDNKELNPEASTLLINSEIYGGSFVEGCYRDRVYKKKGAKKLDKYNHTKIESDWPETLGIINAYDLNKGDSQNFGNGVEVTLCDKSEGEKYLFKVVGGVGGCILLIDKKSENMEFFSDIDEFTGIESIKKILLDLGKGDLEQDEAAEDWFGGGELIDDLIGHIDKFFELEED